MTIVRKDSRRRALLALTGAFLALAATAGAQSVQPAGRGRPAGVPKAYSGQMIRILSSPDTIDAYLSRPVRPVRGTLVIVHEWWGLADWVKKVGNRFAAQGYLTIVPDLYRGRLATELELAHELSRGLPQERAVRDIRAAAAYVQALNEGRGTKTGAVGFCMGGGLALQAALDGGPFQATVVCYGSPATEPARLATLAGPVLGIFGADDRGIGPDQTRALEKGLKQAEKAGTVRTYKGVGHAFLNEERPGFKAEVAKQAWAEIDSFLAGHVAGR